MISVLIPTKNEQANLPSCLESVAWSDDIHVYDSGSSDLTVQVAQLAMAHVVHRVPDTKALIFGGNEAEHKNWALRSIHFKYEWVLQIDADERVTPDLLENLRSVIRNPGQHVAFRIQRRDFFRGTWLKHVQATSSYVRLFRPEKMCYERLINPVSIPDGPVGEIPGYIDHFPFSKGIGHWLDRHNSYSTLEARQILSNYASSRKCSITQALFAKHPGQRRFHQKELFYRLPLRPLIKFLLLYFAKRGFLDGSAGFTYASLQLFYEYMIVLKTSELISSHGDPDSNAIAETFNDPVVS
jgi:glycosyltransferase involved in cell wall biosynthesis